MNAQPAPVTVAVTLPLGDLPMLRAILEHRGWTVAIEQKAPPQ